MTIAKVALQVILGLTFLFTGGTKLLTPKESLPDRGVTGFENIPPMWIKYLACTEITGALLLLIFSAPSLPQVFSKMAGAGFALLMIGATYHHWRRREYNKIGITICLLILCLLILFLINLVEKGSHLVIK